MPSLPQRHKEHEMINEDPEEEIRKLDAEVALIRIQYQLLMRERLPHMPPRHND